jgi:dCTP deaminase
MAVLSDRDILFNMNNCGLEVSHFEMGMLQPASIDLKLGEGFLEPCSNMVITLDGKTKPGFVKSLKPDEFLLFPGRFALGTTREHVKIPNGLVARVEGKSSIGRIGLCVHATAGYIDPGFEGQITLEFYNMGPATILLKSGFPICQLAFERLTSPANRPYGHLSLKSKYQGQTGVTGSALGLDPFPGMAAEVQSELERGAWPGNQLPFRLEDRVFHKRADLFGQLRTIEPGAEFGWVKYEWPVLVSAEPVRVPMSELIHAVDAPV